MQSQTRRKTKEQNNIKVLLTNHTKSVWQDIWLRAYML